MCAAFDQHVSMNIDQPGSSELSKALHTYSVTQPIRSSMKSYVRFFVHAEIAVAKSTVAMQQSNMIAARDRDDLRSVAPQHLTLHFQQRANFEKLCLRADQSHTSGHCKRQDHRHGLRCFQRFACHQELSAGNWNI